MWHNVSLGLGEDSTGDTGQSGDSNWGRQGFKENCLKWEYAECSHEKHWDQAAAGKGITENNKKCCGHSLPI